MRSGQILDGPVEIAAELTDGLDVNKRDVKI